MPPILRSRTRFAVLLSAAAAAAIAVAVIASTGAAQGRPTTLHFVATAQPNIGFAPDHAPMQGDRFGGGAAITGDDTGIQRSVCTAIGTEALCNIQLNLSQGNLSAQGLVPNVTDHTPIPLTGGTGAYNGARGTAVVTQITPTKVEFTVRLRSVH